MKMAKTSAFHIHLSWVGKHPKEIQSEIIQGHLQFGPKLKKHNKIIRCIDKVLSSTRAKKKRKDSYVVKKQGGQLCMAIVEEHNKFDSARL